MPPLAYTYTHADTSRPEQIKDIMATHRLGHLQFPLYIGSCYLLLRPKSQTLVWDIINMQNVLNHVSDWSSNLTGKRYEKIPVICTDWLINSKCRALFLSFLSMAVTIPHWATTSFMTYFFCLLYICLSESWSDLVGYFGLRKKFQMLVSANDTQIVQSVTHTPV